MKFIKSMSLCLILSLSFSQFCSAQSWWGNGIKGEGPIVEKEITMSPFNSLGLSVSADVIIQQGARQKVVVKGQANIIENLKTNVRNESWEIKYKKNVSNHKQLTIYITVPKLENIALSGSGSIIGKTLFDKSDEMGITVSGSGDINLEIETKELHCSISGSGGIKLKGSATEQNISVSGSGDVDAFNLDTNNCTVRISGSGDCDLNVSEKLKVTIAGSGDVTYKGSPKVRSTIVGSGDVQAL